MFENETIEAEEMRNEQSRMDGLVAIIVFSVYGASCGIIGWLIRDYY